MWWWCGIHYRKHAVLKLNHSILQLLTWRKEVPTKELKYFKTSEPGQSKPKDRRPKRLAWPLQLPFWTRGLKVSVHLLSPPPTPIPLFQQQKEPRVSWTRAQTRQECTSKLMSCEWHGKRYTQIIIFLCVRSAEFKRTRPPNFGLWGWSIAHCTRGLER
jgi:hypothetical protein